MDKYDLHLRFLIEALPDFGEEACRHAFLEHAKRDVRKALFFLFQPQEAVEDLMTKLESLESHQTQEQQTVLKQIFYCYCPNNAYSAVVSKLEKGIPFKIDSETLPKLKAFRRAPRKELIQTLFRLLASSDKEVIIQLLEDLQPFGRELEPLWATVDAYANYKDKKVAKAALNLLARIPMGVQKSIITFAKHCASPEMCFHALSAMQLVEGLPPSLLLGIFNPIIKEYRRLMVSQGKMNDMWEEFRLVQQIARNNGVILSIPDLDLGRF